LLSVNIPNNVTSIGQSAFYGCSSLLSINIPNKVTSIGQSAFYGCSSLPSITIPNSVTSIGDSAFRDCTKLESITLPFIGKSKDAETYEAVFGYIFGYTNTLSSTPPSGATNQYNVSNYYYYHYYIPASLKTVIITGGDKVPDKAFFNCTNLTSITIPESVTIIGISAFYMCTGLTSFNIPKNVSNIADSAFSNCTGLTSITLPESVNSIGWYAFYLCTSLTSVTFQGTIPSGGFSGYIFGGDGYDNLRSKFYEIEPNYGTPGTYTWADNTWTKQ